MVSDALLVLAGCIGIFATVWSILATIGWLAAVKTAREYRERCEWAELDRSAIIERKKRHLETVYSVGLEKGYKSGTEDQRTKMLQEVGEPRRLTKRIFATHHLSADEQDRFRHEAIELLLKEGYGIRSEFTWSSWVFTEDIPFNDHVLMLEGYVLVTPLAPAPTTLSMKPPYSFEYRTTEMKG